MVTLLLEEGGRIRETAPWLEEVVNGTAGCLVEWSQCKGADKDRVPWLRFQKMRSGAIA